jgi:hypothetical protein
MVNFVIYTPYINQSDPREPLSSDKSAKGHKLIAMLALPLPHCGRSPYSQPTSPNTSLPTDGPQSPFSRPCAHRPRRRLGTPTTKLRSSYSRLLNHIVFHLALLILAGFEG